MKNLRKFYSTLLLTALLLVQSCVTINPKEFFKQQPTYQVDKPFKMQDGAVEAPLLSQKGQIHVTANTLQGGNVHVAAAVTSQFAVLVSGSLGSAKEEKDLSKMMHITYADSASGYEDVHYRETHKYKSGVLSLAVGHYKTFGKSGRCEQYAGMAYGSAENSYTYCSYKQSDADIASYCYAFRESRMFRQYFIQNNLGFVKRKSEGALIARMSYLQFDNQHFEQDYPVETYTMVSGNLVFQPGIKFGYGSRSVRFQAQCGANINLTGGSDLKWYSTRLEAGVTWKIRNQAKF